MSNHFVSYFKGIVISNMNCLIVLFKLLILQFMFIYNYFWENLNYMAEIICSLNCKRFLLHFVQRPSWKKSLYAKDILVYYDTLKPWKLHKDGISRSNTDLALFMTWLIKNYVIVKGFLQLE